MTEACIHGRGSNHRGYCRVTYEGRSVLEHRLVYALHAGLDVHTMGGVVMHSCDNPACVNPAHLSLGTQRDNVHDMLRKGRAVNLTGEAHGNAKLTDQQVRAIQTAYSKPGAVTRYGNGAELCRVYGISKQQLSNLINHRRKVA